MIACRLGDSIREENLERDVGDVDDDSVVILVKLSGCGLGSESARWM